MDKIKVFIIDDHKLFIEGLCSLLAEQEGLEIHGYSMYPVDFSTQMHEVDADVFIIDINMPEMSGITLTRLLTEAKPDARILALTMHNDYRYIEKMLQSGALGYALKSENIKELVRAIKTVATGKRFISDGVQETISKKIGSIHRIEESDDLRKSKLTKREIEILLLIIKEFPNKMIAEKLFISERTVETHRKNIFSKTNTNSAISLLKYAIKEGIYISE